MIPLTVFLSAFLLFQVEPLLARYILPWFGGGSSVWTVCLLFYQVLLLVGYAYAHWISGLALPIQRGLHAALAAVSVLFLPVGPQSEWWKPAAGGNPTWQALALLSAKLAADLPA